ncbi:MAG: hypothetical protein A2045_01185 [Rhodocyclales bacterium GWA2_65_20]|nr:MAG: hypothetical protein A2045_01185 [Rhodocyclales bacterium GWA2_65_20]
MAARLTAMQSGIRHLLRVACAALLALTLASPAPADAAAMHRKAPVKHKHAAKKPAAVKHAKVKKAKVKKAKPAVKKIAARKSGSAATPKASKVHAARKAAATDKPRPLVTARPEDAAPAVAENGPARPGAKTACRRGDKIYLLADCDTSALPTALATGPTEGEPSQLR